MTKYEIEITELPEAEFCKLAEQCFPNLWYRAFIRAFAVGTVIYVNKDAKFLFRGSKNLVLMHEIGHAVLGLDDCWFSIMMVPLGIFRL